MLYQEKNFYPPFAPMPDFSIVPANQQPLSERPASERPLVVVFSRDEDAGYLYRWLLERVCRVEAVPRFEVLERLAGSAPPALILLDGVLKFEKTLEDIRRVRRSPDFGELPLILVSGFVLPSFRERALAAGADEFLVKPLDFDLLEQRVEKLLEDAGRAKIRLAEGN